MKKILGIASMILCVFIIYLSTIDRKVYFLALSSEGKNQYYNDQIARDLEKKELLERYIDDFSHNDYRLPDFIRMIQSNQTITINHKQQSIKNALIKADIVILDIGKVDLFSKLTFEKEEDVLYDYIDAIAEDMKDFLELVRLYCKEDIYILKIYNPKNTFSSKMIDYMNQKIQYLAKTYKLHYIDYEITDQMIYNEVDLNQEGQKIIYKSLNKSLSKTLFSK